MASFRKRQGRWQARIKRQGAQPIAKTFLTRGAAEKWARSIEVSIESGDYQDPRRPDRCGTESLGNALERYVREVTPKKKNARAETYILGQWRRQSFADTPLDHVTPSAIATWRDDRLAEGTAPATIRNALAALSAVYQHAAMEWGYRDLENPVRRIRRPAPGRARARRVTATEIDALCAAGGSPDLPDLIRLAVATGMRAGELVSLTWDDIDIDARTAHLSDTKNGDARTVPLSSEAVGILKRRESRTQSTQRVFQLTPHAVSVAFRRTVCAARTQYCEACARDAMQPDPRFLANVHFHDLRHEAVSRLFELGLNPMEVASISGHRTLQMLKRYTHLKASELAKKLP